MTLGVGSAQLPLHSPICPFAIHCSAQTRTFQKFHPLQQHSLSQQCSSLSGTQLSCATRYARSHGRVQLSTQAGMFGNFTNMFNKDGGKVRRQMQPLVDKVNALEPQMQSLSDEQLKAKTDEFKQRHQSGETLDALLVESFAVSWRPCTVSASIFNTYCVCPSLCITWQMH